MIHWRVRVSPCGPKNSLNVLNQYRSWGRGFPFRFWGRDLPSDCSSSCSLLSHYFWYPSNLFKLPVIFILLTILPKAVPLIRFSICLFWCLFLYCFHLLVSRWYEPRSEKTGLRSFQPGSTQTKLYGHRRSLETWNFRFRKKKNCTIRIA